MATAAYAQIGNDFLDRLLDRNAIDPELYIKHYDAPFTEKLLLDYQKRQQQMAEGNMPEAPMQVPGADQQQAAMATNILRDPNTQMFTRNAPNQPFTEIS